MRGQLIILSGYSAEVNHECVEASAHKHVIHQHIDGEYDSGRELAVWMISMRRVEDGRNVIISRSGGETRLEKDVLRMRLFHRICFGLGARELYAPMVLPLSPTHTVAKRPQPSAFWQASEGVLEPPGLGNLTPESIALIADRPTDKNLPAAFSKPNWPYCSNAKDGVSLWLAGELEAAEIPEERLYWQNAYDRYGKPTSAAALNDYPPRAVICLGKNAHAWATTNIEAGTRIDHVFNPQHWRTHGGSTYPLIGLLRRYV